MIKRYPSRELLAFLLALHLPEWKSIMFVMFRSDKPRSDFYLCIAFDGLKIIDILVCELIVSDHSHQLVMSPLSQFGLLFKMHL